MVYNWKREKLEKLILSVQQYPCLYSVRSAEYMNRLKKAQAFNNILEELSKSDSSITLEDIKRKWSILRNQFMRERRLIKYSKKSGAGMHHIYVPKLWCFELLGFLQSHIDIKRTIDYTESQESIFPGTSDDAKFIEEEPRKKTNDSSVSVTKEQQKKNKKVTRDNTNLFSNAESYNHKDDNKDNSSLLKIYKEYSDNDDDIQYEVNSKSPESADEASQLTVDNIDKSQRRKYEWVGDLVASQIEEMDLEHRGDFAWDIQCLVRKYLLKSKLTTENNQSTKLDQKNMNITKDITFQKGSNISLNINFL